MAINKKKPLSDDEVLVLVEEKVRKGVGYFDSKLSRERERVIKYYNSQLPLKANEGKSGYVSTDVYDAVEAMKSQLLETFAGNPDNLVSFPPQGPEDIESARIATEYATYQVFRLNEGYDVFSAAIHDGLTARVGVSKVYWEECYDDVEEELPEASYDDVQALAARDDIPELEAEETATGSGVFKGKLTRRTDRSQVRIAALPPEEFIIEKRASSIKKAGMCSHCTLKGKDELIKEGYDPKKVARINWSDARSLDLTPESLSRTQPTSDGLTPTDDAAQTETEKVMFYETFIKLDLHNGKGVRLYKVCHAGNVHFETEEVDRAPFIAFIPLPVPHVFHGNNFGARVIPTQNARTVLTRAILDHASVTTNPRWGVVKGGLLNPKEMLDNRLGGIVNLNRPDAVKALEQQQLNPFVFQTLEMLKQNKEESTGISALSQGMNKDAISTQNSQGLVQDLVTLSQQRQKIIARNFVYGYLIPLYLEVYRLVLENEKKERIIEVTGNWVPVSTEDWIERTNCKVAIHVGYGEREKQSQKFMGLYQALSSDPGLGGMFGPQNRYELIMDGLKADGSFENRAKYLTPPNQVPPAQPDPLKVKELDIKDKQANASVATAQATTLKAVKSAETAAQKEVLNEGKAHADIVFKARDADRKDAEVAVRNEVALREVAMLEQAPQESRNAIVSPS